jgi:vancomycin permeability regulator SanA
MKKDWMNPHKWVNLFCWGILVEIPMILARYFKTYKWYIWVHGMLLTAIVFTSLVAEGLMIYSYDENYIWDNFNMTNLQNQVHLVLGTTITIMIFV